MKLHRLGKSLFSKAALATAALAGLLFFAGAPGAQAADRDDGHRRFEQSDRRFTDGDRGYYNQRAYQPRYEYRQGFERYDQGYRNNWNRDRDDHYRYDRDRDRDRR
jgi:hypothetical protein